MVIHKALPHWLTALTVTQIEDRLKGIQCGMRGTSCVDQLSHAVREAYEAEKNNA